MPDPSERLERLAELISAISSEDLAKLRHATEAVSQLVPGLLAWLEHAIGWELDRRGGFNYGLGWPAEAIPPEEEATSVTAARAMAASFRHSVGQNTGTIVDALDHVASMIAPDGRTIN